MNSAQANQELVDQIKDEIVSDNGSPVTQISPALIALLLELLPILVEFLIEQCNKSANDVIGQCQMQYVDARIWLNWKVRRTVGRQAYQRLGGRTCGRSIMKVVARPENNEQVHAMFNAPPEWSSLEL